MHYRTRQTWWRTDARAIAKRPQHPGAARADTPSLRNTKNRKTYEIK